MKTILLFFLSLGITIQSFAQAKGDTSKTKMKVTCCKKCKIDTTKLAKDSIESNTIVLNFKTKHFEGLKKLEEIKRGEFYQLKITNINMNLYKVAIETKDTTITSTLTFPTFDMVNLGGIDDVLKALNDKISSTTEEGQKKIDKDILTKLIQKEIDKEVEFLNQENQAIKICKYSLDSLTYSIQKNILRYSIIDAKSPYYESLSTNMDIDKILRKADDLIKQIKQISNDLYSHKSGYTTFTSPEQIKDKIKKNSDLRIADSLLLLSFNSSTSLADKMYESISTDKIISWLTILINKENNKGDYLSLPQQLNGSETKLKINITPQKEEYGLPSYMTTIKFPQRKRTYVGIGMGFYGATFKNNAYSTSATVIDSAHTDYTIVDEKNKRGEIGLVTLLHFGVRCEKYDWLSFNLSTGPALSFTSTVKPRIALGAGVAFGRNKQMLSINALFMAGYVDQKSNVYDTNTTYNYKPENVTVNKLAGAFGLSLGYIYKF